jgi:Subtilase family
MPEQKAKRFILLPTYGVAASADQEAGSMKHFMTALSVKARGIEKSIRTKSVADSTSNIKVLDSVQESGAKLVEMKEDDMSDLRMQQPGIRIVPEVFYKPAVMARPAIKKKTARAGATVAVKTVVTVLSKADNKPVAKAHIVAFTNFADGIGAEGDTDKNGVVKLNLNGAVIQRLYVFPVSHFWGALKKNIAGTNVNIVVEPISLNFTDGLRKLYPTKNLAPVSNVKIAVVDTGVGPHPHLPVSGGANCVQGEQKDDFGDNGDGHGTHVAGIIAANSPDPVTIKGIAVGATIRSYRVFGKNSDGASNFDILKAINKAVEDGCHLINMSLGGGDADEALQDAIREAFSKGSICIVATGNDGRSPVSFPASFSVCIAVSAMGTKDTFPAGATQSDTVKAPFSSNKKHYVASFSNIGAEVDMIAPGVGIISTVPGGYAVLDGTSMACPAATGLAARILAANPALLQMPANQLRAEAFIKALAGFLKPVGFGAKFEGKGRLKPA